MVPPAEARLERLAVELGLASSVARGEVEKIGELDDEELTLVLGVLLEVETLEMLIAEVIEAI
jgi:hypothetical protein